MKSLTESINDSLNEEKITKQYYVGHATGYDGPRSLDYVCGPYDTLDAAKVFLDRIAEEFELNHYDYEWSTHINIYRSTKVDYVYCNNVVCTPVGKRTKGRHKFQYDIVKGKHGGISQTCTKRTNIPHISEEEFIERIKQDSMS